MIRQPRRTLAGAVLAAAVLLVASPADGQDAIPLLGEWDGTVVGTVARQVTGELKFYGTDGSNITRVELTLAPTGEAGASPTCLAERGGGADLVREAAPSTSQPAGPLPTSPATATFSFTDVSPFCNGDYVATVIGTAALGVVTGEDKSPPMDTPFAVALPAPPVTVAAAVGPDRAVTLTWGVPAGWEDGAPPDFTDFADAGYVVQRAVGDGSFETIDTTARDRERTVVDTDAPADAPTARYRVVATRSDGDGEAVEGDLAGAPVTEARLTPEAPPTTPAPPTTRAPAANVPGRGGSARPAPGPQTGPRADDVFEETLPFDIEPGEAEAVLPEDAARFLQDDGGGLEDFVGAGVLVPSSIAALLASWALHLRYLARRAAVPG